MVRGGFRFQFEVNGDYRYVFDNARLHEICCTRDLSSFIKAQQSNYVMYFMRMPLERSVKSLIFNDDRYI